MTLVFHLLVRSRSFVMPFLLATLLCLPACLQHSNPTVVERDRGLSEPVQTATEMKTRAEQSAMDLKKAYGDKKVSEKNYKIARDLYGEARAAIAGWVAAMQTEIELGKDPAKSSVYKDSLNNAAGKAQTFIAYAQGLLSDSGDKGTPIVGDIVNGLIAAGEAIWKEYASAQDKKKEVLVKRMDTLKWEPYDKI
jgi:hypothetical protein